MTIAAHELVARLRVVTDLDGDVPLLQTSTDRLRIAFGVNDTVIRHLFSIGLDLHTTRALVSDPAQVRLDATIEELDVVIRELRSLIFDLQPNDSVGAEVEAGVVAHGQDC